MIPSTPHRSWLLSLARGAGEKSFDPATGRCLIVRDTCWYAIALLCDQDQKRREAGRELLNSLHAEDATHTPATLLAILSCIPETLDIQTAAHCSAEIRGALEGAAETEWRDGNVNHPLAAYATLILGGERHDAPWATALGSRRLNAFRRRIGEHRGRYRRQSEMSEYNSPTYTALTLWWLALLAEFASNAPARADARFLEERLWVDIAMHFHAPSQQFAGPHSRAYLDDSSGGFSALHCTMLAAFDDPLWIDPTIPIRFNHPSALIQNSLVAILPYHLPQLARQIALEKPFPYSFRKITYGESYHENSRISVPLPADERLKRIFGGGHSGSEEGSAADTPFAFDEDVYPGGWSELTTHMTGEYALGSATLPYVNAGHSDSFMLRIRRAEKIAGPPDYRSAFTRGVFNDARIGAANRCHCTGGMVDESYLTEEGRSAIFQHAGRAIVCYVPKRAGHLGVSSFRLDLFFTWPLPFDELLLDDQPISALPAEFTPGSRICFRDYRTYGMILPLPPDPAPSPAPVRIWTSGGFLLFSFFNYDGPRRDFTRHALNSWRSGFAIELATADEISWNAFRARAREATFSEGPSANPVRHVRFTAGGETLEGLYDPLKEAILGQFWNGTPEGTDHFQVNAAGQTDGPFVPQTLFGREADQ